MKQCIRVETFETNSSSYHTLAIVNTKNLREEHREIIKGQDLEITSNVKRETLGWSESYQYIAKSNYEKAQCILRFIAFDVEHQLDKMIDESEYTNINEPKFTDDGCYNLNRFNFNRKQILKNERFYDVPLIKAFINAIKRYIGEEYKVIIIEGNALDGISDEEKSLEDLFNVSEDDLKNVEIMTDKFYDIIFNPDYVIREDCESNE